MKCIYVLGAGASIGHMNGAYPAIDTFFRYAKKARIFNETVKSIKEEYSELRNYVLKIFNKNIMHSNERINIEELLTFLDIENDYNSTKETFDIREDVLSIITKTLLKLCDTDITSEYKMLIEMLNPTDTVLTFNWDILLDNKLGRKKFHYDDNASHILPQYQRFINEMSGQRKDKWTDTEIKQPYSQYNPINGLYIKLHGSVDWFYCPNQSCPAHIRPFTVKDPESQTYCGECHSVLKPLIIPPVLNKSYKAFPFINMLWNTAVREISCATKIVIWGYSIPPTDFQANWLLRQAQNYNLSVDLINPECKMKVGSKEEHLYSINTEYNRRVSQILKNQKNISIRYFEDFKDYMEEYTILKKYNI